MRSKYNAKKTLLDGIKFDSKKEARRYVELKLLEKGKYIKNLTLQPKFLLQDKFTDSKGVKHQAINYIADFSYIEDGKFVVEDVKGIETTVFKIKKKLLLYKFKDLDFRII